MNENRTAARDCGDGNGGPLESGQPTAGVWVDAMCTQGGGANRPLPL